MDITEEIIDLPRGPNGLGFNIRGGIDVPHLKNDHGIFVTKIRNNGTAFEDGRLQEGDKILEVNGKDLRRLTHNEAVQIFINAGSKISLLVQHNAEAVLKKKMEESEKEENQTTKYEEKSSGISVWTAIGVTVLLIGGVYAVNKYVKLPWSAFNKWLPQRNVS